MVETINGVLCVSVPEASEKSYKLLIGVYTLIIILTVFLLLSEGSDYLKPAVHVYLVCHTGASALHLLRVL